MKKSASLFLVFSILILSGNLIAKEKKFKFNLAINKAELPRLDLDSFSLNRDFLFSLEKTLYKNPPVFNKVKLYFYEDSNFWEGAKKGALKGALIGGGLIAIAILTSESDDSGLRIGPGPFVLILVGAAVGAVVGAVIGGITEVIS